MECPTLAFIRNERVMARFKREHHEVMRCTREEQNHKEKCAVCAGWIAPPLYLQLWSNATVIGVDLNQ